MSSCGPDGVDCSGVVDVVALLGTMVDLFPRRWASNVRAEMLEQWRIVPVEPKLEELSSRVLQYIVVAVRRRGSPTGEQTRSDKTDKQIVLMTEPRYKTNSAVLAEGKISTAESRYQ